jgi:Zn-dependent peptidase ImmA (M78 family)
MDKLELNTQATTLRKELGEDSLSPIDVFNLAYTIKKLTLVFYPMSLHLSGICIKGKGSNIIAINSSMTRGRQRFSLAHELYHLYFDEQSSVVCAQQIGMGNKIEKEADQFASYFLAPPAALKEAISDLKKGEKRPLGITDVVRLEQQFGVSRQAMLYRLIGDKELSLVDAETMRQSVIRSASNLGFNNSLYKPTPTDEQYRTYGDFIQMVDKAYELGLISSGKYEEMLLSAFRPDLVYGNDEEGEEVID